MLVFGGIWNMLIFRVAWEYFLNNPLVYLVGNAVGGFLLIFPFWKWHFGDVEAFDKKTIWSPLLVVLVIFAILMAVAMWFRQSLAYSY